MQKNRKIKPNKWYLVDTIKHKEPRLIRIDFDTKADVISRIEKKLDGYLRWDYVSGKDAIANKLRFKIRFQNTGGKTIEKYDYAPEHTTIQERKSFRTKFRRHAKEVAKKQNKSK